MKMLALAIVADQRCTAMFRFILPVAMSETCFDYCTDFKNGAIFSMIVPVFNTTSAFSTQKVFVSSVHK